MSRHLDVAPADAIGFLSLLIGWNGGVVPVYLDGRRTPSAHVGGSVAEIGATLARRAAAWDLDDSAQVEIGLPEPRGGIGGPGHCTVLWCWLESRDQVWRAAKRFRPAPTMVLRIGGSCRRLAVWGLREAVPYVSLVPANKKLAYALHAPQKWAEPEKLRVPLPGTFIRIGRKRPAPVLVTKMALENTYARSQIVARLREPPAPWAQRQRESGAWR